MPTLPTFTVTQAQADRLLAAFGSVDAYKAWLKEQLITYVSSYESQGLYSQASAQAVAKEDDLRNSLSTAT